MRGRRYRDKDGNPKRARRYSPLLQQLAAARLAGDHDTADELAVRHSTAHGMTCTGRLVDAAGRDTEDDHA